MKNIILGTLLFTSISSFGNELYCSVGGYGSPFEAFDAIKKVCDASYPISSFALEYGHEEDVYFCCTEKGTSKKVKTIKEFTDEEIKLEFDNRNL